MLEQSKQLTFAGVLSVVQSVINLIAAHSADFDGDQPFQQQTWGIVNDFSLMACELYFAYVLVAERRKLRYSLETGSHFACLI